MNSDKICAGYTDTEKSACFVIKNNNLFLLLINWFSIILQNDEGAPLMCFSDENSSWELQGILSSHQNCGKNSLPAIYTNINSKSIREWIVNTISENALF